MNEKLTEQGINIIGRGYKVGNGPGAFFLRPILKTIFGCVWSRDWQNWFAPDKQSQHRAQALSSSLEDLFATQLSSQEKDLLDSLLPNRDKE